MPVSFWQTFLVDAWSLFYFFGYLLRFTNNFTINYPARTLQVHFLNSLRNFDFYTTETNKNSSFLMILLRYTIFSEFHSDSRLATYNIRNYCDRPLWITIKNRKQWQTLAKFLIYISKTIIIIQLPTGQYD